MLFSIKDLHHLIAYFTSKKGKLHYTDKSHIAINLIKQLSEWETEDCQKTKLPPSAK